MGKYDPLLEHLCRAGDGPVEMSEEIDRLVGCLPSSAETWPAWWANETGPGSRHVQARAWLDAGREVEHVDRAARRVRFSAAQWRRGA